MWETSPGVVDPNNFQKIFKHTKKRINTRSKWAGFTGTNGLTSNFQTDSLDAHSQNKWTDYILLNDKSGRAEGENRYGIKIQCHLTGCTEPCKPQCTHSPSNWLPLVLKWSHLLASPYWNWTVESLCFRLWTSTWSHCWVCQTAFLGLVNVGPEVHTIQLRAPELSEYKDRFDAHTIGKLPVLYHMWID